MFKKNILPLSTLLSLLVSGLLGAEMMDRVLVIVNEDVITQSEFNYRMVTVRAELQRDTKQGLPADLEKKVLDGMVADRLQLQEAGRRGIEITAQELDAALQRFAAAQGLDMNQLKQRIRSQGQSFKRFSQSVKESLIISRLTEYYARTRVVVPDYEIEGFIEQNNLYDAGVEYQIARIFIGNPEENRPLAERVLAELKGGSDFRQAVLKYSQASDAEEGGVIGWRSIDKLPDAWAVAIKDISVGGITDLLETDNGLHILKLTGVKGDREEILQAKVRHILIRAKTKVGKSQAAKKLFDIRQRILAGEAFPDLARIYSDDAVSAAAGGELGWVSPGDTVQPFEQAFQKLQLNEVSKPVVTRFGVHILEVLDRRQKNVTEQVVRNRVESILRRQRAEREFEQWVRELREQAYIEYVSGPA